ncbi:hypothetical protein MUCCIDRAFT_115572 [Mucor lusitanicus CBS 277.49]|uniref:Uncharacterized protein n=1 Tax=Mucor lusitanicus CBS 277.49 TaxID=747725 RepID=A0A162YB39_MUCCL|nr:hypothetical protein MUCCIDRAFT_115572 [Mucor lusitanicus CBS 277.49]
MARPHQQDGRQRTTRHKQVANAVSMRGRITEMGENVGFQPVRKLKCVPANVDLDHILQYCRTSPENATDKAPETCEASVNHF